MGFLVGLRAGFFLFVGLLVGLPFGLAGLAGAGFNSSRRMMRLPPRLKVLLGVVLVGFLLRLKVFFGVSVMVSLPVVWMNRGFPAGGVVWGKCSTLPLSWKKKPRVTAFLFKFKFGSVATLLTLATVTQKSRNMSGFGRPHHLVISSS